MDQAECLNNFPTETFSDLIRRFKEFNDMLVDIQPDESDKFEGVKKKLESAFTCWEDIAASMYGFKTELSKRNLIKESLNVPSASFLTVSGSGKRDSGIDTASSFSSSSPYVSSVRLSAGDEDLSPESRDKVTFNLQSTRNSVCDVSDSTFDETPEPKQSEISTVYIHILPSDPNTDISVLREKIHTLSRSTLKTDNVQLHIVPSDAFIGIPSRHSSVSTEGSSSVRPSRQISTSSEGFNSVRARLPSSNDSLMGAIMNMSFKIPEEHTDSSDDQRFVSSSDSDLSVARLQLNSTETQTESENNMAASNRLDYNSVETQTD